MVETAFFMILLHFTVDFAGQTKWQALNKKKKGKEGFLACLSHCLSYTIAVMIFLSISLKLSLIEIIFTSVAVFYSHWIFDRYDFIQKYCNKTEIKTFISYINEHFGKDYNNLKLTYPTVEDTVHLVYGVILHLVVDQLAHIYSLLIILKVLNSLN